MVTNQFGLPRGIPDPVNRQVRQACGFGCVVCGASIVQYEHVDPEFPEAREHDPAAIALLCGSCHDKVTRNFWSKEKIKAARQNPRCKQEGFSWGEFDFGNRSPLVRFAGMMFTNCPTPVTVRGVPLFRIEHPEEPGGPFRLSATFQDGNGNPVLQIVENEWRASTTPWDVEFTGGKIVIRQQKGEMCLVLRADPPDGIAVERLRMRVGNHEFEGNERTLHIRFPSGSEASYASCFADNCAVGLAL